MLKGIEKVFKGKGKPKEATWSVADAAIHGIKGPGQLESQNAYEDFVLQIDVRVNSKDKGHHPKTAVLVRADAGKLGTGYEVQTENAATGGITGLKPPRHGAGKDNQYLTETIAVRGRHFEVWVDGIRVNEYDDTRTEGPSPKKEARIAAGTIALLAPDPEANLDFRNIKIDPLPKALGGRAGVVAAAATPPPVVTAAPPAAAPGSAAPPGATQPPPPAVIVQTNPNQAKDDAKQAQVSKLTQQALHTDDPAEQVHLYESILELDPNNVVASQGYHEAQAKIQQTQAQKQKTAEDQARHGEEESQKQATFDGAMKAGEEAFLAGNLVTAQSQLAIAQRAAPDNPQLRNLQSRVNAALQVRQRITWLAIGGGLTVLLGGIAVLFLAMGKKEPYLEVVEGPDQGKRFALKDEVVHLGAIAQDGEAVNEIVLRDRDRMISRFHCEIHRRGKKLFLIDVNSANGTFLDRKQILPERPMRLKKGSQVTLGDSCTLRVGFEAKKKE